MPYILEDLIVDRVDLVDEGANTGAFIEVFKRKEKEPMDFSEILSKMKPEHAEVINQHIETLNSELSKAREDLDAANGQISEQAETIAKSSEELSKACDDLAKATEELNELKATEEANKALTFDEEEVLKSMPEGARSAFIKMREQKEAAEEQVRKAAEEKAEAEAVAKAHSLKALPVEHETLVQILKSCDQTVVDVLSTVATAIEGTVLTEVGKSGKGKADADAWEQIEAKADEIAKRDSITKQKAIGIAIKENPELYKEYLNGGNN